MILSISSEYLYSTTTFGAYGSYAALCIKYEMRKDLISLYGN